MSDRGGPRDVFDVLVVGAGPAGATAAIACKQAAPEARVALLDKSSFPRDKVCGDGLGPGAVRVLERLGLRDVLDGEVGVSACEVVGPAGSRAAGQFTSHAGRAVVGYVVPRLSFDQRLVAEADAVGVELLSGRAVGTTAHHGRGVRSVTLADGGVVGARVVVGADGANSRIRAALGVARNPDHRTGIAIRCYATDAAAPARDDRRLVFELSERFLPAYAWYFPGSSGIANIGLGVVVRDLKRRKLDLRGMLEQFCAILGDRGHELGERRDVRTYLLPHGARLPALTHHRAVLIGDAASMINPLSGEGIAYGMAAGSLLAEHLAPLAGRRQWQDDEAMARALQRFQKQFRARFCWHFRSNYLAQQLLRSRRWAAMSVRAAGRDARVLDDMVDLLFGEGRITVATTRRLMTAGFPSSRYGR